MELEGVTTNVVMVCRVEAIVERTDDLTQPRSRSLDVIVSQTNSHEEQTHTGESGRLFCCAVWYQHRFVSVSVSDIQCPVLVFNIQRVPDDEQLVVWALPRMDWKHYFLSSS